MSMAARSPTGCVIRSRFSRRCVRRGRRTSRCRCASLRPTGPRAVLPVTMRSPSPAPSARPASIWSMSRPDRPCTTRSRFMAGCSRRRSPNRSAERGPPRNHVRRQHHDIGPGQHHPRRRPRRSGGSGPAASGRSVIYDARGGPGMAQRTLPARRNICPARSRSSAIVCVTGRISRTSKLRVSRKHGRSSRRRRQSRLRPNNGLCDAETVRYALFG